MNLHKIGDALGGTIAGASILFRVMPPPEKFNDWPKFQNWYRLVYTFVQWIALNK